jgi:hypothetical protein
VNTLGSLGIGTVIAALITAISGALNANNLTSRIDRLLVSASSTTDAAQRAYIMGDVAELKRKRQVRQRTRVDLMFTLFFGMEALVLLWAGVLDSGGLVVVIFGLIFGAIAVYLFNNWSKTVIAETAKARKEIT